MAKQQTMVCTYDFTLPQQCGDKIIDHSEIIKYLSKVAKTAWCFQLEKGTDSGYIHYQGRFRLNEKNRISNMVKTFPWKEIHLSPTSKENRDNMFYVCKEDTRIGGPWDNHNHSFVELPRQIREIKSLYPWQEAITKMCDDFHPRLVHIIYDTIGNIGKSIISNKLGCERKAMVLPFCRDYEALLGMVQSSPISKNYIIDLPRALDKSKLQNMFAGIETIKSGYAFDKRYKFQSSYFDSPNIFVFTNNLPDFSLLSQDRWKIWIVNDKKELVHVVPQTSLPVSEVPIVVNTKDSFLSPAKAKLH